jgi:phosphoglycolate phosphatase
MRFSAVIFDLDGTLLNTLADIADSANRVFSAHGLPTIPRDRFKTYVGEGVTRLFERSLPEEMRNAESIEEFGAQFRREYAQGWNVLTEPYVGATELLREVAQRGIPMSVLSNKPHEFTVRCVSEYFAGHEFELVLGVSDETPPKPDPAGALRIVSDLGVTAEQTLYLGDTGTDMQTAVAAGLHPVGALWGFRAREELVDNGAVQLIASPLELLPLLDG